MKPWAILLAALLAVSNPAHAALDPNDHLVPEDWSVFSDLGAKPGHDTLIEQVFEEMYGPGIKARMFWTPSFDPEMAVAIYDADDDYRNKNKNPRYKIIALEPNVNLYEMASYLAALRSDPEKLDERSRISRQRIIEDESKGLPDDPKKIAVARCESGVDTALAQHIEAVWKIMLRNTRYLAPHNGLETVIVNDGESFHFSAADVESGQFLVGQAKNPGDLEDSPSPVVKMVHIGFAIRDYCKSKDEAQLKKLEGLVDALSQQLQ